MFGRAIQCQPVTELKAKVIQIFLSSCLIRPVDIVHPIFHQRILLGKQLPAAIIVIEHLGHQGRRIAPDPGTQTGERIGQVNGGGTSVSFLVAAQIPQKLAVECPRIHVEPCGGTEHLRVAGPAQPFIPLGTVRGHIQKVGFQPPQRIGEKLVDLLVPGMDTSGLIHLGIDGATLKAAGIHMVKPADLYIAEAEKGKAGTNLSASPVRHIGEFGFGVTVIVMIEVPVLQHFAKFQRHGGSFGNFLGTDHMTGEVLTEIQNGFPGGRMNDLFHRKGFPIMQRRGIPLTQLTRRTDNNRALPVTQGTGMILCFAVVNVGKRGKAAAVLPGFIGADCFDGTIGIYDAQLRNQRQRAVIMRRFAQPKMAPIPAVPQQDRDFIALFQQIRHIVGAILIVFLIVVDKGSKKVIACLLPVDGCLKDAKTADIKSCGLHIFSQCKRLEKFGMGVIPLNADPLRLPRLTQLGSFKKVDIAFCLLSHIAADGDLIVVPGIRLQGQIQHLAQAVQTALFFPEDAGKGFVGCDLYFAPLLLFPGISAHLPGTQQRRKVKANGVIQAIDSNCVDFHFLILPCRADTLPTVLRYELRSSANWEWASCRPEPPQKAYPHQTWFRA